MRRVALVAIAAAALCGCVGVRVGHRWSSDGSAGPYAGGWTRLYVAGEHRVLVGAEGDALWFQGGRSAASVLPGAYLSIDNQHRPYLGILLQAGYGQEGLHLSACATTFEPVVVGACVRGVPRRWVGVDAELGVALLTIGGGDGAGPP